MLYNFAKVLCFFYDRIKYIFHLLMSCSGRNSSNIEVILLVGFYQFKT